MTKAPTMKALRLVRNWTRQQLADKAEVSVMTIMRAEDRNGWPKNPAVRKAVQAALGMQS